MAKLDQTKTPYFDVLKKYVSVDVIPFDVPGHQMGNVDNELKDFLGNQLYRCDINAPIGLDNLANPKEALLEAERLMADFCNADEAFFLINGTSSGILTMIMTACKAKEKIILPRNVHKSIVSALILSGAVPIYIMPKIDADLEIANQPTVDDYINAMHKYPSAKAIFIINPTYFGSVNDLKRLVKEAHSRGVSVLVDEAHGAHYYFDKNGPISAMDAGADMSAVSFHKTGGSLTQTSILLAKGEKFKRTDIQKTLNIINTTSPSTILLASLDAARKYVAINGQSKMDNLHKLSQLAREEISKIPGFKPVNKDHFIKKGSFDNDDTKLCIELDCLDINGFELYHLLKDKHNIQIELAETYVIMAILAIGTTKEHVLKLIEVLKEISKTHYIEHVEYPRHAFGVEFPFQIIRPRSAYHAPGKLVQLEDAVNCISKESIMIYPPGIPLIVPGEVFTDELIKRIENYRDLGVTILSDYGAKKVNVVDTDKWKGFGQHKNKLVDYLTKRKSTPRSDGYFMPFEGEKHSGTIVLLPFRKDTWRDNAKPALENYKKVIFSIAEFEPVYVGINTSIYSKCINDFLEKKNVYPIKIKYNDAWARDNCPIFVIKNGKLRTVDFRFNAWGGEIDGLYSNFKDDDALAKKISKHFNLESYRLENFVLEGGSIHVDGEGTCLVTEACLLSRGRNPDLNKLEIEENLKIYLNVSKVIWLKNGIYNDETNEHVDNMCCFLKPGKVALAWTDDENDPQYKYSHSAYETLSNTKDAMGRNIEIIKLALPKPIYMSKAEAAGIKIGNNNAKARPEGLRLAASYVNFYQGKDFVILPAFGVPEDELAKNTLKQIYPEKKIVQINTKEILLGGGNIHCITMQIPYSEEFKYEN